MSLRVEQLTLILCAIVVVFGAPRTISAQVPAPLPLEREYGFIVYVTPDAGVSAEAVAAAIPGQCHIVAELYNGAFRRPSVSRLSVITEDGGLAQSIRSTLDKNMAGASDSDGFKGSLFDGEPHQSRACVFKAPWVMLPEAQLTLPVLRWVDQSGRTRLIAESEFRLKVPAAAANAFPNLLSSAQIELALEQLSLQVARKLEADSGIEDVSLYAGFVHRGGMTAPRIPRAFELLLEHVPLEKALHDEGQTLLDRLNMTSKYGDMVRGMLTRSYDNTGTSIVGVPGTDARFVVASGTALDPRSMISIATAEKSVLIGMKTAELVSVRLPKDCSLRAKEGGDAVVVEPNRGLAYKRVGVETSDALMVKPRLNGSLSCRLEREDGVLAVHSLPVGTVRESTKPVLRVANSTCIWDDSCRVWVNARAMGCQMYVACSDDAINAMPAHLSLELPNAAGCNEVEGKPGRWSCPNATSTNDCFDALKDARWGVVRSLGQGVPPLPLCQARP